MFSADPLNHFDYPTLDDRCFCEICVIWRSARERYDALLALVAGHARSCRCADCKAMRRSRTHYHGAVNRRDLYCELSYHAAGRPPNGDAVNPRPPAWGMHLMQWVKAEVLNPAIGAGWWEGRAPYMPLASWLNRFTAAVGAVSGMTAAAVSGIATSSI